MGKIRGCKCCFCSLSFGHEANFHDEHETGFVWVQQDVAAQPQPTAANFPPRMIRAIVERLIVCIADCSEKRCWQIFHAEQRKQASCIQFIPTDVKFVCDESQESGLCFLCCRKPYFVCFFADVGSEHRTDVTCIAILLTFPIELGDKSVGNLSIISCQTAEQARVHRILPWASCFERFGQDRFKKRKWFAWVRCDKICVSNLPENTAKANQLTTIHSRSVDEANNKACELCLVFILTCWLALGKPPALSNPCCHDFVLCCMCVIFAPEPSFPPIVAWFRWLFRFVGFCIEYLSHLSLVSLLVMFYNREEARDWTEMQMEEVTGRGWQGRTSRTGVTRSGCSQTRTVRQKGQRSTDKLLHVSLSRSCQDVLRDQLTKKDSAYSWRSTSFHIHF